MIARIWHGWTTPAQSAGFESVLAATMQDIDARAIAGLLQVDRLRRDAGAEIEFTTIMWFDTIEAVERFAGDDPTLARVPPAMTALLARFDQHVEHHHVIGRHMQPDLSRGRE